MTGLLRRLSVIPKAFRDAMLAPAHDPRVTYGASRQRQQRLKEKTKLNPGELRKALKKGFSRVNSDAGLTILLELGQEYDQLLPVLTRRKETDPLSVAHVPGLVEETYQQGLSVLEDALELTQAIYLPDAERLEAEVARLELEIESLSGEETQGTRVKMKEELLASHRELLDMIEQEQLRVDELLHQSHRCEASLRRTRIELAALRADSSGNRISTVTDTLKKTIKQAREVQEEMKRLGY